MEIVSSTGAGVAGNGGTMWSGIDCGVVNARFVKPLDTALLQRVAQLAPRILTLEEHLVTGGFGSAVLEEVERWRNASAEVRVHAIPDQFIDHGPQAWQRANSV